MNFKDMLREYGVPNQYIKGDRRQEENKFKNTFFKDDDEEYKNFLEYGSAQKEKVISKNIMLGFLYLDKLSRTYGKLPIINKLKLSEIKKKDEDLKKIYIIVQESTKRNEDIQLIIDEKNFSIEFLFNGEEELRDYIKNDIERIKELLGEDIEVDFPEKILIKIENIEDIKNKDNWEELIKRNIHYTKRFCDVFKKKVEDFNKSPDNDSIFDNYYEYIKIKEKNFGDYLKENKFYFSKEIIESFLLSLKIKPFLILTGNSGTGKTKLVQLFAQYISILINEDISKKKSQYSLIPVGANWTENRNILGYENIILNEYNTTPALNLILEAKDHPDKPYFLIFDEMNLSHVERYFSDFLSAMESGESIHLYTPREIKKDQSMDDDESEDTKENTISTEKKYKIPPKLKIPPNLFIIGTVNIDETTYMFSPKVLDRANVLEFETIAPSEIEKTRSSIDFKDIFYLENILNENECFNFREKFEKGSEIKTNNVKEMGIDDLKIILNDEKINILNDLTSELTKLQKVLEGSRFVFGFRIINEILRFMVVSWVYENHLNDTEGHDFNWETYFDIQIKQKILPKLHGSEREIKETLENLKILCIYGNQIDYTEDKNNFIKSLKEKTEKSIEDAKYKESAKKLDKMIKVLDRQKYVSFIN